MGEHRSETWSKIKVRAELGSGNLQKAISREIQGELYRNVARRQKPDTTEYQHLANTDRVTVSFAEYVFCVLSFKISVRQSQGVRVKGKLSMRETEFNLMSVILGCVCTRGSWSLLWSPASLWQIYLGFILHHKNLPFKQGCVNFLSTVWY